MSNVHINTPHFPQIHTSESLREAHQFGYFYQEAGPQILVVFQPHLYEETIREAGFPHMPKLTRPATSFEIQQMAHHTKPTYWLYDHIDELIDDEIKAGMDHQHLGALIEAYRSMRMDQQLARRAS